MSKLTCIICHMEIIPGKDNLCECANGHPVHDDCLKEWLRHSPNCPLCNSAYSKDVLEKGRVYSEQKEKEKNYSEKIKRIEKVADKIVFLKMIDIIEKLIESEQFNNALEKLEGITTQNLSELKSQKVLFLKGKTFYLLKKYDLAIGHLFKLVKQKFDFPEAFLYLGKSYQALGLEDKAKWAFDRIPHA